MGTLLLLVASVCHSADPPPPVRVELGREDTKQLIDALRNTGYPATYGNECCDDESIEEALGLWIGRDVPVADVKAIVALALDRYPQLCYFKYFNEQGLPPDWRRLIYVGGSKWAAVKDTRCVSAGEAKARFDRIGTEAGLDALLRSFELKGSGSDPTS